MNVIRPIQIRVPDRRSGRDRLTTKMLCSAITQVDITQMEMNSKRSGQ